MKLISKFFKKRWSTERVDCTLKKNLAAFIILALYLVMPGRIFGQSDEGYRWIPAPDVWYNSVDGVRVGVRLRGHQRGSFADGPHRLNAGVWLGTKFPDNPVSYYFSYTEPIAALSGFNSEANVQVRSKFRTGFQKHGLWFNKRWQPGFNEFNYKEISLGFDAEHRFDKDYLLYPQLWQNNWLYLINFNFLANSEKGTGSHQFRISSHANVGGKNKSFLQAELSYRQNLPISKSFSLTGRIYSGFATKYTAPEYLFSHSMADAQSWMNSGFTRARGTIPPNWIESGNIQVMGGAHLRGYLKQDVDVLNNRGAALYTSLSALNVELNYPNPLNHAIRKIPFVGELIRLRSYLFYDGGTSLGFTKFEEDNLLSDAGPGFQFSIDIPDYLGKSRGLIIRYDLPLWLSHPGTDDAFKFRNVVGISTSISF